MGLCGHGTPWHSPLILRHDRPAAGGTEGGMSGAEDEKSQEPICAGFAGRMKCKEFGFLQGIHLFLDSP